MKVLIVDDIPDTVKGISDACDDKGWEKEIVGFDDSYGTIINFDPDVIILDWKQDADAVDLGKDILDKIWGIAFRPIIIFSANAALIDITEKEKQSNMLCLISKGDEEPVIEKLSDIEKTATALSAYRKTMGNALITSLNSIEILKNVPTDELEAVEYVLSKRAAAFFDDQFVSDVAPAWVEYLCPPVSESLNVCDIIRENSDPKTAYTAGAPEEYWIVLTPSCDLCEHGGTPARVTHALCAQCTGKKRFHNIDLTETPKQKNIDTVKTQLSQGYNNSFVSLPGLSTVLPYMTVELKKTQLVPLADIAASVSSVNENTKYIRVASVSSPFREQIVWAHMLNSCRPGVPDRNFDLWAKELLTL